MVSSYFYVILTLTVSLLKFLINVTSQHELCFKKLCGTVELSVAMAREEHHVQQVTWCKCGSVMAKWEDRNRGRLVLGHPRGFPRESSQIHSKFKSPIFFYIQNNENSSFNNLGIQTISFYVIFIWWAYILLTMTSCVWHMVGAQQICLKLAFYFKGRTNEEWENWWGD